MIKRLYLALLAGSVVLTGCPGPAPIQTTSKDGVYPEADARFFVQHLNGLTEAQVAQFNRGREVYEKVFTPAEGLGPLFNRESCRICHSTPNTGGTSDIAITLVAYDRNGAQLTLQEQGAPSIQDHALGDVPLEKIPLDATVISHRIVPPTFGDGLLEAVPTDALTAQLAANPEREKWGIHAKANWEFTEIGRFGWKAQKGDIVDFAQQGLQFEMGVSSPGRPQEHFPNLPPQELSNPANYDDPAHPWVKEFFDLKEARGIPRDRPDVTQEQVDDLVAFIRFQAPPEPLPLSIEAQKGQALFRQNGCIQCHMPELTTGPNTFGVPAGMPVRAYSDLLIHDMGPSLSDGMLMGVATGQDWRTAPLWGLRFRDVYLHDGRANTLHEAITLHGGEGARAAAAYASLSVAEQGALEAFLNSL